MTEQADPRIVHVASELAVDLAPTAENEGNREFILDVIDAVDYANEQCGTTYEQGRQDERVAICGEGVTPEEHDRRIIVKNYDAGREQGQIDEREKHHANQCCRVCDTHTMPHRGCILR
jgi:hypothetical protein